MGENIMIRIVLWIVFFIPLFSLFFLKGSIFRRYIAVAMFVTIINTIIYQIAWTNNWWRYYETLFRWDKTTPAALIYSGYWVATIWIFHFTFRKFWTYFIVNIIVDGLFVFVLAPWMRNMGITSGKMSGLTMLLLMTVVSTVIYLFQIWYERGGNSKN
jgi:hypothetical protein